MAQDLLWCGGSLYTTVEIIVKENTVQIDLRQKILDLDGVTTARSRNENGARITYPKSSDAAFTKCGRQVAGLIRERSRKFWLAAVFTGRKQ